ncbi:M48 family metalloprotease, partial [Hydrocarboniphaga effusa]|uniref:M48 family metalloprotease n=1 Tax=Hydrocarboniphaga effusa TaxID=243629 RepID=UPI0035AE3BD3
MLLSIPGRLFGPEQPAAGSAVFAAMDDIGLRITTEDGRHLAPTNSQLQLRYAGFDGKHWQLSWSEGDRHWALLFDDAAAIAAIEHEPPAGLREAVAGLLASRRRGSMRRGLGLSAIGLWLALPLLLLVALFVAARPLSGWLAGFVPLQQEVKLGDWFFDQQRAGLDLITDTPANAALEAIGARLSEGSAYPFRWHVVRDPTLNAFAIPGGIVVVHSGLMLAADGADELAGVIAHE